MGMSGGGYFRSVVGGVIPEERYLSRVLNGTRQWQCDNLGKVYSQQT